MMQHVKPYSKLLRDFRVYFEQEPEGKRWDSGVYDTVMTTKGRSAIEEDHAIGQGVEFACWH